jgi:hypothetical protein
MYEKIGIEKLSPIQIKKLVQGQAVRIKLGDAHYIHLSQEQLKKLNKAFKHGKAVQIMFDPYQQEQHGSGLFGDIANFVKKHSLQKIVNPVIRGVKQASHSGVSRASNFLHSKIDKLKPIEGEGILSDILGAVSTGTKMFGLGVARKKVDRVSKPKTVKPKTLKRVKRGKGFLTDLVKNIASSDTAKNIIKDVVNKGVDVGVKALTGGKVRGRPRKIVGSALLPAGY